MKKIFLILFCLLTFSCLTDKTDKALDAQDNWGIYDGLLESGYPIIVRKNL